MNPSHQPDPGAATTPRPFPPRLPSGSRTARPPRASLFLTALLLAAAPWLGSTGGAAAQVAILELDTVRAGRFDYGKMWTFEYPPVEYFTETYGFQADTAWFRRARLAALRIPGCSAAFVSPHGLVVTNHHCARGAVRRVTRPGEDLLDTGFFAASLEEERPIPGYYADQLIAVEDVSTEVLEAVDAASGREARVRAREDAAARIAARLRERYAGEGPEIRVEVVPLYNGGRYSAYVFRRYTDVRLVAAVELQLGFFGGDPDNFTYPRYALDFAFYRIYGADGSPLETEDYFTWSRRGVEEGDVVFVIGNPGPTNRLNTMAQLHFQRDVLVPATKRFLETRLAAMREFYRDHPEEGEAVDLRNRMFSLSNSLKAYTGRLSALTDPVIMARKADGERRFQEALEAKAELASRFGGLVEALEAVQEEKREEAARFRAFVRLGRASTESALLRRALAAAAYLEAVREEAPAERIQELRGRILAVRDHPDELEESLLRLRLADLVRSLGPGHPVVQAALEGRSPEGTAGVLLERSVLADSAATRAAIESGTLSGEDPGIRLGEVILSEYRAFQEAWGALTAREQELAAELGRARFEVYGTAVPPDASRSPRITDGVVKPYEYNGTLAPVYTTLYGLYDHYYSYGAESEWALPPRWLPPPPELDLRTPLNFVSTADTYGGNSGSPAVTPELEIVGLNFDRNIEGLSRDFIYLPERGRNVMVDVRAIRETLDHVYDADRIVEEILTHRLFATEAEADAAKR